MLLLNPPSTEAEQGGEPQLPLRVLCVAEEK